MSVLTPAQNPPSAVLEAPSAPARSAARSHLWQHVGAACLCFVLPHLIYAFLWWGPAHQTFRIDYPVYQPAHQMFFMQAVREGFFPLWAPGETGGRPFASYMSAGQYWPVTWLMLAWEPVFEGMQLEILTHVHLFGLSLGGFFTYLVMRRLGLSALPALVAGVVFMFNLRMLDAFRHGTALDAVVWLPVLIYLIERIVVRPRIHLALGYALAQYMLLTPGHFQEAAYCLYFANLYLLARSLFLVRWGKTNHPWKWLGGRMICFGGGQLLALGLCAVMLLPIVETALPLISLRMAGDPRFYDLYHMTWDGVVYNLFFPWLACVGSSFYGGQLVWLMVAAAGATLVLRALPTPRHDRRMLVFLFVVWILCILYALGSSTPIAGVLNAVLPHLSHFRAPGRVMSVGMFVMAALAAYGVRGMLRSDRLGRVLLRLTFVGCVVYLLAGLALWLGFTHGRIACSTRAVLLPILGYVPTYCPTLLQREPAMLGMMGWTIMAVAVANLAAIVLCRWRRISQAGLVFFMLAACLVEANIYHRRTALLFDHPVRTPRSDILREADLYHTRIAHPLAVNHDNLPERGRSYETTRGLKGDASVPPRLDRFLIQGGDPAWRIFLQTIPGYEIPRAYITPCVQLVHGNDLPAIAEMDPYATSIVDLTDPANESARFDDSLAALANGKTLDTRAAVRERFNELNADLRVTTYTCNRAAFAVDTPSDGLFHYSDRYAEGWRATLDGVSVPIYRANHTFKALALPAGKHRVAFIYDPPGFRAGLVISLGSACVLAACAATCLARTIRRRAVLCVAAFLCTAAIAHTTYAHIYERAHRAGLVHHEAEPGTLEQGRAPGATRNATWRGILFSRRNRSRAVSAQWDPPT